MYIAEQDCCNSTECPKYSECERALRSGISHNYYTTGSHTEWCDTEGNCGRLDSYDCGEKGNWGMFLVRQSDQYMSKEYKEGDYIIYTCGERCQIGRIKRIVDDGAFVYYHEGDTASKTPFSMIHKLENAYVIKETSLGGQE